jgi:hydrogenase maturation protease
MNRQLAKQVADAVLYEGYMLYPYRRSAMKNRQRWSFGILYPPAYPEVARGTERSVMHSECLLMTGANATVEIELRFLHLAACRNEQLEGERQAPDSWDEGVERSVRIDFTPVDGSPLRVPFSFLAKIEVEPLPKSSEESLRNVTRAHSEVTGSVLVSSQKIRDNLVKLVIDVVNETSLPLDSLDRNTALLRSLVSAHTVLVVTGGEFVSLLDPPETLRAAVGACRNVGNFPVLLGESDTRDMLLCSPILLYDYPQIAPESAGNFFDSTEMDEMLTLRVMTLTDGEKNEMRLAGGHGRDLLQRTEESAREQLTRTHGTIRSLRPVSKNL